jgi:hypothetical protein
VGLCGPNYKRGAPGSAGIGKPTQPGVAYPLSGGHHVDPLCSADSPGSSREPGFGLVCGEPPETKGQGGPPCYGSNSLRGIGLFLGNGMELSGGSRDSDELGASCC